MTRWQIAGLLFLAAGAGYVVYNITRSGIDKIKRHEALRLTPYQDVAGKWTIGYGHLLRAGEWYDRISEDQAEDLLREDLGKAESAINQYVTAPLNPNQYDALVSFVYNVGATAFKNSTLLRKLNQGDYDGAAGELQRWKYAGGKISAGLVARRQREETLFRTVA